jgi:hypothetical protein
MSLRKGRANHGPLDMPLHLLTAVQRNAQERNVKKKGTWPVKKQDQIDHLTQFVKFANSIGFDRL